VFTVVEHLRQVSLRELTPYRYGAVSFEYLFESTNWKLLCNTRQICPPRNDTAHSFWIRRFARIYPMYFVAWLLFGCYLWVALTPTDFVREPDG
jgi:hypothetical protein